MTPISLQNFLHENIPATAALGLIINEVSDNKTILTMPHHLNHNHKHTAFGGSIALGVTACGWAMVHASFPEADGNIVIQQGQTQYLHPAHSDLTIVTHAGNQEAWQKMRAMFSTHGKGKIELETEVFSDGKLVATFQGKYVALSK